VALAADATPLDACFPVLASYTAWYADPHLFVFQSQNVDTAVAARRAADLRMMPITEAGLRESYTLAEADRDPIEGIWYEGRLRLGVIPDVAREANAFAAVVLASDTAAWPVGAVRAEFTRAADGTYATRLLTRRFAELSLTARIHKRTVLRLSPGM